MCNRRKLRMSPGLKSVPCNEPWQTLWMLPSKIILHCNGPSHIWRILPGLNYCLAMGYHILLRMWPGQNILHCYGKSNTLRISLGLTYCLEMGHHIPYECHRVKQYCLAMDHHRPLLTMIWCCYRLTLFWSKLS